MLTPSHNPTGKQSKIEQALHQVDIGQNSAWFSAVIAYTPDCRVRSIGTLEQLGAGDVPPVNLFRLPSGSV
jgi:hypothetical protein